MPALRPDVTVVHAQQADRHGNVQVWGITGIHKEAVLAAERSLVTVEEKPDELDQRPGAMVLPTWAVTLVAEAPGGAQPSYAQGYSERDNAAYQAWDAMCVAGGVRAPLAPRARDGGVRERRAQARPAGRPTR